MKIKVKSGTEVKLCASKDEATQAIKTFGVGRDIAREAARLAWNGSATKVKGSASMVEVSQFAEIQ